MNWHEVTDFVPSKIIVNMVHSVGRFFFFFCVQKVDLPFYNYCDMCTLDSKTCSDPLLYQDQYAASLIKQTV